MSKQQPMLQQSVLVLKSSGKLPTHGADREEKRVGQMKGMGDNTWTRLCRNPGWMKRHKERERVKKKNEEKLLRHKHFLQSRPYPAGCEGTETDQLAKFGGPGSVDLTACKWEVLTRNFSGSLYLPSSVESHKHRARFYTAPIRHHSVQCQIYSGKTTNYPNNVTRERHVLGRGSVGIFSSCRCTSSLFGVYR